MSNTVPCKNCAHFEQQHKYRGSKLVEVWYGWCRRQSVYPAQEWDKARPFDVDAQRMPEGAPVSKPFIVDANGVRVDCIHALKVKP